MSDSPLAAAVAELLEAWDAYAEIDKLGEAIKQVRTAWASYDPARDPIKVPLWNTDVRAVLEGKPRAVTMADGRPVLIRLATSKEVLEQHAAAAARARRDPHMTAEQAQNLARPMTLRAAKK